MGNRSSSRSLLPKEVITILNKGMIEGFQDSYLNISSKKINDSMMLELCEWLAKLVNKVKIIFLSWNEITSVGASMLFDTLRTMDSSTKQINMFCNEQIDDDCMKSLGEYIKSNKNIERILLGNSSISDAGVEILAPYLDGNKVFKQLYLDHNKRITDKSIPLLMKMIESSCIENINIDKTSITQKKIIDVLLICNSIKNGSSHLELLRKDQKDDDLIMICESMKKYGIDNLNVINLRNNKITSKGASVLFDTLKECNSVVSYLNLSHNQLNDESMEQLGEYLQDNEYVEKLKLGRNNIRDRGVEMLSAYLIGNITMIELYLHDNNGITDESAPHIMEMVNKSCIAKLDLRNTSVSKERQIDIQEALLIPIEQREIPIKSNTKSAAKISVSI